MNALTKTETDDENLIALGQKVSNALKTIDENPMAIMVGVMIVMKCHIELLKDIGEHANAQRFIDGLRMIVEEHKETIQ